MIDEDGLIEVKTFLETFFFASSSLFDRLYRSKVQFIIITDSINQTIRQTDKHLFLATLFHDYLSVTMNSQSVPNLLTCNICFFFSTLFFHSLSLSLSLSIVTWKCSVQYFYIDNEFSGWKNVFFFHEQSCQEIDTKESKLSTKLRHESINELWKLNCKDEKQVNLSVLLFLACFPSHLSIIYLIGFNVAMKWWINVEEWNFSELFCFPSLIGAIKNPLSSLFDQ